MNVNNRLTREFLLGYPAEAARVLEQVSAAHVAALFTELPVQTGASVMTFMLPEMAAACLKEMTLSLAAKLIDELPVSSATRIYRILPQAKQEELSAHLSAKTRNQIHRFLKYPAASAGALLDPKVDMLPDHVTVAEAIRRIEHSSHSVSCDIYIVNDAHQLVGLINLGRLMTSNHHARLREIMSSKTQPVYVHMTIESLLSHPGWAARQRLPVVERDNTLVGGLDYSRLRNAVGEPQSFSAPDPMANLLSLAGLYWLSMAQLLDSLLSITKTGEGERQ